MGSGRSVVGCLVRGVGVVGRSRATGKESRDVGEEGAGGAVVRGRTPHGGDARPSETSPCGSMLPGSPPGRGEERWWSSSSASCGPPSVVHFSCPTGWVRASLVGGCVGGSFPFCKEEASNSISSDEDEDGVVVVVVGTDGGGGGGETTTTGGGSSALLTEGKSVSPTEGRPQGPEEEKEETREGGGGRGRGAALVAAFRGAPSGRPLHTAEDAEGEMGRVLCSPRKRDPSPSPLFLLLLLLLPRWLWLPVGTRKGVVGGAEEEEERGGFVVCHVGISREGPEESKDGSGVVSSVAAIASGRESGSILLDVPSAILDAEEGGTSAPKGRW